MGAGGFTFREKSVESQLPERGSARIDSRGMVARLMKIWEGSGEMSLVICI